MAEAKATTLTLEDRVADLEGRVRDLKKVVDELGEAHGSTAPGAPKPKLSNQIIKWLKEH